MEILATEAETRRASAGDGEQKNGTEGQVMEVTHCFFS
jgi:hypothetical protein